MSILTEMHTGRRDSVPEGGAPLSRRREVGLLLLVFAILALGYFVVWQAYLPAWRSLYTGHEVMQLFLPLAAMCAAWLVLSAALSARRCRDRLILPVVALLTGLGMLFLLRLCGGAFTQGLHGHGGSLGTFFLKLYQRQMLFFWISWAALLAIILGWRDYRALARYKYLLAATAIVMLLVTTFLGVTAHDKTMTLHLGPIVFQPHDPVKLLLVIFLAAYLVEKRELISFASGRYGLPTLKDLRFMGPLLAVWLLVMAIVYKQKDLGAAALIFGSFLGMLYIGTGRKYYLAVGLGLFVLGIWVAYLFFPRVQARFAIWHDPWHPHVIVEHGREKSVDGYQICQALMAMGNGRLVGAGLAGGYPELIPEVEDDMMYPAISEDLGLLGAGLLIVLFLVLIARIFRVALLTDDPFGRLMVAGLAVALAVQAFVILGGTTNLIPLTGVPLPFVSYGGTSLLMNFVLLGLVLKVAEAK